MFLIRLTISIILLSSYLLSAETEIGRITFTGNSFRNDEALRNMIHSQEGDEYEPRLVKLDKILLTNFYRKNGFLTIAVSDSVLRLSDGNKIHIRYEVSEGRRYYYGGARFSFSGTQEISETQLRKPFNKIEINSPFDESRLAEARQELENLYYNSGKPFVQISYDYRFEEDSLVYAVFDIAENQTVYIKDIKYSGLKIVQKFIIRRELELKKGDMYNRKALEYSQQNIYSTALFKYVRFEIEPIAEESQQVILHIMVQEKDARWVGFQLGVAHEQDEFYGNKFDLTLQGGHRNLFGTGRSMSLHLTPSLWYGFEENRIINPQNRYAFQYVEPWIGATRTPGILSIIYDQKRPINFPSSNEFLASFDLRHHFKEQKLEITGSMSMKLIDRIETNGTVDTSVAGTDYVEPESRVYAVSSYTKRDSRGNLFNPKNGSLTDLSLSLSNSFVKLADQSNDENTYITLQASWARYQPWRPTIIKKKFNWTLATRLKAGTIIDIGRVRSIPFTELFTAGGAMTVRGYQEQLLGPAAKLDEKGKIDEAAGGKLMFIANAEVRIPIFWLLVAEYFIDAGNVWREIGDFSPGTIRPTTGFGLALITPLGPVRVDYGYKLMPTDKDPSPGAIHAGIYFAF